jgi:hypothetical protein
MATFELPTGWRRSEGSAASSRWLYGLSPGVVLPRRAPRTCQADGLDVVLDGIGGVLPLRSFLIVIGTTSSELFHGGFSHGREATPSTSRHRAWKQDLARGVRGITYVHFAATRLSTSSYEDIRRGMSRGANHRTREATRDTGCEQEAQVGRRKTPAITRSTGLRRRWRRFESCRGHHGLTCMYRSVSPL